MRPVRRGDGVNRSRRLSISAKPRAVASDIKPYTKYVGDRVRGIFPSGNTTGRSFKLGTGVKLGQKKLGG